MQCECWRCVCQLCCDRRLYSRHAEKLTVVRVEVSAEVVNPAEGLAAEFAGKWLDTRVVPHVLLYRLPIAVRVLAVRALVATLRSSKREGRVVDRNCLQNDCFAEIATFPANVKILPEVPVLTRQW